MKRLLVLSVIFVVVVSLLMTGCAVNFGSLQEEVRAAKEETIVTKAIVSDTNIRVQRVEEIISRKCTGHENSDYFDEEKTPINSEFPKMRLFSNSIETRGGYVAATGGNLLIITSLGDALEFSLDAKAIRKPGTDEGVFMTGDFEDEWAAEAYRMQLIGDRYVVSIPMSVIENSRQYPVVYFDAVVNSLSNPQIGPNLLYRNWVPVEKYQNERWVYVNLQEKISSFAFRVDVDSGQIEPLR